MRKRIGFVLICSIMVLTFALTAYASGGNGDGSGDGSGGSGGLTLTATSIIGGQIEPGDSIILTFSNNVINVDVRENNKQAISLLDNKDNAVPIDVILADEQIYPDAKRLITVKPLADLLPGAEYTLVVNRSLQAKNGSNAVQDYRIAFSVAGEASAETPESEPPEDGGQPEPIEAAPAPQPPAAVETASPENTGAQVPNETEQDPQPSAADESALEEETPTGIAEPEPSVSSPPARVADVPAGAAAGSGSGGTTGASAPGIVDADSLSLGSPDIGPAPTPNTIAIVMFACAGVALCALVFVLIMKKKSAAEIDAE